jgi:predicted nucleic acid-binding protein
VSIYIESSAAGKMLIEEAESPALAGHLNDLTDTEVGLVSSVLLETELRRMAIRYGRSQAEAAGVLDRIELLEPDRAIFTEAGLLPGTNLRSLDALHVAVAIRAQVEAMITYDQRQATGAQAAGLPVVAPGASTSADSESTAG